MEPEKMTIAGVIIVVVVVGFTIGISVLAFQEPANDLSVLSRDRDLLSLGLQVPSDWEFKMADGSTLALSDFSGSAILVDLMATWCDTCTIQNGYLESAYDSLSGSLVIISLTIDRSETVPMMNHYKNNITGLPWAHGLDSGAKFTNYFSVTAIPTLVLIDGDGYFRFVHVGLWSEAVIADKVSSL
ncbi:MAG: TlpA family protein disulfide reductase [Candidatus Thorarchaeota archaeon]